MKVGIVQQLSTKPLKRISPSRFVAMQQCALREVFAAAGNRPLLPVNPSARVGSIIHKLLQDVGSGAVVQDKESLNAAWSTLVSETEGQMKDSSTERFLVPLRANVSDLEVRRIRAIHRALSLKVFGSRVAGKETKAQKLPVGCEVWVQSTNGRVGGFIDVAFESSTGIVICDYKSGSIIDAGTGHNGTPKDEYVVQLKLYSALYFETFGFWPIGAELLPLVGEALKVVIEPENCVQILANANQLFNSVNARVAGCSAGHVDGLNELASPGSERCVHCLFRPGCPAYKRASRENGMESLPDVIGEVAFVNLQGNKRYQIGVSTVRGDVVVRQLSHGDGRHGAIEALQVGDTVGIFDVQFDSTRKSATETNRTTIYCLS